jgi:hypothetical protein
MALDELLKGLGAFQQGMTQYGVGQGIQQAKAQVDEINAMQMKEMEKRQALQQVSNNLMATLAGTGADPATIQQAAMPFVQQQLKTSQDFLAAGTASGDQEMLQRGRQLQNEETRVQRSENEANRSQQRWGAIYGETQANKRAEMAASGMQAKRERLPVQMMKQFGDSRAFAAQASNLLKTFESDPKFKKFIGLMAVDPGKARSYFNTEMKQFRSAVERYSLQYRKSMTGSAASDQEDERIRNAIANLGTNPEAFSGMLRDHLGEERVKYEAELNPLTQQGFSTAGYEWEWEGGAPAAASSTQGAQQALQAPVTQGNGLSTPLNPVVNRYIIKGN